MLELAEDEQQAFIEDSKKRVLGGLKASKRDVYAGIGRSGRRKVVVDGAF